MVFQRSMLAWMGVGSICHRYMCIVLYINLFGVMVFQTSMFGWRRGWGQSAIGICALCYIYMKLICCNGFSEIYAQLEEGVGSICHGYMCIVLYMQLILCNGFAEIHAQLEEGVGSICHRYICIVLYIYRSAIRSAKCGVAVFKASMFD